MRSRGQRDVIVCEAAGGLAIPTALLGGHDHAVWLEAAARSDDIFAHCYAWRDALREFLDTAGPPLVLDDGHMDKHVWYHCVVEAAPELARRGVDADRAVALADMQRR